MRHIVKNERKKINVTLSVLFVVLIFLFPYSKVSCNFVCRKIPATFLDMKSSVKYVAGYCIGSNISAHVNTGLSTDLGLKFLYSSNGAPCV